jgi:hypothetical protein
VKLRLLIALCVIACSPVVAEAQQNSGPLKLLTAAAVTGPQLLWPGGAGVFTVAGVWNGATVTLQYVGPDGTTLVTAGTAGTLTANGNCVFYLPRGLIQATISAAGGSTALSASASVLPNLVQ